MIEAHGRLGLYKCVSGEGKSGGRGGDGEDGGGGMEECPYSFEEAIKPSEFPESVRAALEDDVYAAAASGLRRPLSEVPRYMSDRWRSRLMVIRADVSYGVARTSGKPLSHEQHCALRMNETFIENWEDERGLLCT